jgi:hypothetical protein
VPLFPGMQVLTIELAAVVALAEISAWQPEVYGRGVLRLLVVQWGTTAFGAIHVIAEYAIMIKFSDAMGLPLPASGTSRLPQSPSPPS